MQLVQVSIHRVRVRPSLFATLLAGLVSNRLLSRAFGFALFVVLTVGAWVGPPVARAFDYDYYEWCSNAIGEEAFCCNKAGGVWSGGSCQPSTPSTPPAFIPPNNGLFIP